MYVIQFSTPNKEEIGKCLSNNPVHQSSPAIQSTIQSTMVSYNHFSTSLLNKSIFERFYEIKVVHGGAHKNSMHHTIHSPHNVLLTSQWTAFPLICSLMPRPPTSQEERGLVTIEQFLGCAESAVLILNNPMK